MAQLINFIIYGRILLYVGISGSYICLRLIVIVVGDKISHIIVGKECLELAGQLSRQGFIMGNNQRRLLYLFNELGDSKGFSCTSSTQQHLGLLTIFDTSGQILNGLILITHRLKWSYHLKGNSLTKIHII